MREPAVINVVKPKSLISDPRVFFSAERTLLAWVRSGIAVMAFGLVIDKFGLLLTILSAKSGELYQSQQSLSHYLGIVLVFIGTLIVIGAQYNHHAYLPLLPPEDLPKQAIVRLDWVLTFCVAVIGILLLIHLIYTGFSSS